ncbi:MAG: alanine--tRNA ligase-related protein, partial [Tepidiformaceae bacterium]
LRRVLRRAIYMARKAGVREPFTARLADAAIDKLKVGYPHLEENRSFIRRALSAEEERFVRTLAAGTQRLDALLARLEDLGMKVVPGDEAFLLYDTFGMPRELTQEIAAADGFTIDEAGFEAALEAQRAQSRQQGKFLKGEVSPVLQALGEEHSDFVGYGHVEADAHVAAMLRDGALVAFATEGQACDLVLSTTPFYPEGGGQMGDRGTVRTNSGVFLVEDTQSSGGAIIHRGRVTEGEIRVTEPAQASVDLAWRAGSARNHTGTHLLHAALRSILGPHVRQQGSLVTPDRLRFDFTHLEATPRGALVEAQQLANEKVRHDLEVAWRTTGYRQAVESGALAFFGDKYGNDVRVVEIKDDGVSFSAELCGGTHVHHTGEIGFVHIVRESSVAAGTRRIEALTGKAAETHLLEQQDRLLRIADRLSTSPTEIEGRLDSMQTELEQLRKQSEQLQRLQGSSLADGLIQGASRIGDANLIVATVEVSSNEALKEVADRLRAELKPVLLVLGANIDGRSSFVVAASPELGARGVHAGNLISAIAKAAGGGGGGSAGMATAGAKDPARLPEAMLIAQQLGAAALSTS